MIRGQGGLWCMLRWLILVINREKGRSMGASTLHKKQFLVYALSKGSFGFKGVIMLFIVIWKKEKRVEVWYTSPTFFFLPFLLLNHRLLCSLILE